MLPREDGNSIIGHVRYIRRPAEEEEVKLLKPPRTDVGRMCFGIFPASTVGAGECDARHVITIIIPEFIAQ